MAVTKETTKKFRKSPRAKQDKLIEEHLYLVHAIANAAFRRLPKHPFEDIKSAGTLGLVDAARRFEPGRGVPFEAYARQRITGSIIDAHRRLHRTQYVNEFPPDPVVEADVYVEDVRVQQLQKAVAPHLNSLTQFERTIIELRYWKNETMRQIAAALGVSECHVSQQHRQILIKLSTRLQGLRLEV